MQAAWQALQPMHRERSMSFATSGRKERALGADSTVVAERARMSWVSRAMAIS